MMQRCKNMQQDLWQILQLFNWEYDLDNWKGNPFNKKSRKDNRNQLLYKDLKGKARLPTKQMTLFQRLGIAGIREIEYLQE